MAKVNPLLASFNAGEFSPKMAARVDIAQYPSACETAENLIALAQGGFARRPGTRYIGDAKDPDAKVRLLPFEFSTEQAYVIEAGDNYFRFFTNQAALFAPLTDAAITNGTFTGGITGWTDQSTGAASIAGVSNTLDLAATGADVAWAEQAVAVGGSYTSTTHVLKFTVFSSVSGYSVSAGAKIKLRIGTTSTGSEIVNDIEFGAGYHCYSFEPTATTIYVQFLNANGRSVYIDNVSLISNAAVELPTPYSTSDVAKIAMAQSADVVYMAKGYSNASTTLIAPYKLSRRGALSWSLEKVQLQDGPYLDQNESATTMTPGATTGNGIAVTASGFSDINDGIGITTADIGRLIRIQHGTNEPGWAVIASVTSTVLFSVNILRDFSATTATATWSLGAFSDYTGYPSAVTFHDQRLAFAGTRSQPQTVFMSQSADLENMRPDSYVSAAVAIESDDALNFTIASREASGIQWMLSERGLILGTQSGEWSVTSQGVTLTPTDIGAKQSSTNGSKSARPLLVNSVVMFIQRAGRRLLDYQYQFERDGFVARDVTKLAEHVTASGITEIHYQSQPTPLVWALRNDGVIAMLTYDPSQEVIGWTRIKVGGSFGSGNAVVESVALVPGEAGGGRTYDSDERDEVWLSVKRTINGATVRQIEVFEGVYEGPYRNDFDNDAVYTTQVLADQKNAFYVDCGLTYNGAATSSISGLDHLEGETVKVWADGGLQADKVVSSGAITLDYDAELVHVGLGYKHKYKSFKLAYGSSAGTAVAKTKRIQGVTFILLDTAIFSYGPTYDALSSLEFRRATDPTDTPVPLFTGEREVSMGGGWSKDSRIYIESDTPAPFFLLALAPEMKTNESL